MRRLLPRMSLNTRLIAGVMVVFCLPMTLLGIYIIRTMQGKLRDNAVTFSQGMLRQIDGQMNETLHFAQNMGLVFSADTEIVSFLYRPQADADTVRMVREKILPFFDQIRLQSEAITYVRLLHENDSLFDVSNALYRVESLQDLLSDLRRDGSRYMDTGIRYRALGRQYGTRQDRNVWYVSCLIPLSSFSAPYGILEIAVDSAMLWSRSIGTFDPDGHALLLVKDGSVLHCTDAALPYGGEVLADPRAGVRTLPSRATAVALYSPSLDATLCCVIPAAATVMAPGQLWLIIAALVLLLAATTTLVRLVSGRLLKKLNQLTRQVDAIEATPGIPVEAAEDRDEIDRLARHCNRMYLRLTQSFEREKQLLYDDLTNELKPHFLCNAMDMLRLQAERYQQPEMSESIQQINQYFRYAMLRTGMSVPLAEESANAANYLYLVNTMREDKVVFDIVMDAWTEEHERQVLIPKMLLQPLIENAVRHGVKQKKHAYITIGFQYGEGELSITVADNGGGMPEDVLEHLRAQLREDAQESPEGSHIGLRNTRRRLQLLYGERFSLEIDSTPRIGTSVRIRLMIPEDALPTVYQGGVIHEGKDPANAAGK